MDPADSSAIPRATPYSGTNTQPHNPFAYGTNTHSGAAFKQLQLKSQDRTRIGPTTPNPKRPGLGYSHFARRYYGNRHFFLFLQVLRCFNSLSSHPQPINSAAGYGATLRQVPPFGHPRIKARFQLPEDYRR